MRSRSVALAVPLLLGPGVLACFSGGFAARRGWRPASPRGRCWRAVAVALPRPLPRRGPRSPRSPAWPAWPRGRPLSLTWAPIGEPAGEDVQRLLIYVPALAAAVVLLREPAAARLAEPLLLAGTTAAIAYGLSERLLPGLVDLLDVLSAGDRLAQPLTYWNATGALAALGLVLAAGLAGDPGAAPAAAAAAAADRRRCSASASTSPSRAARWARCVAGLAVLLALAPTRAQLRGGRLVAGAATAALAGHGALPAVAREASGSGQGAAMLARAAAVLGALAAALQRRGGDSGAGAAAADAHAGRRRAGARARRHRGRRRAGRARDAARHAGGVARRGWPRVQSNRYAYWRSPCARSAATRCAGSAAAASRPRGCASGRSASPCATRTRCTWRRSPSWGSSASPLLALLFGGVAAAARRAGPGPAGPVAALAAWALHAGRGLGLGAARAHAASRSCSRGSCCGSPVRSGRGGGWSSPMSAWLALRRGTASPAGSVAAPGRRARRTR